MITNERLWQTNKSKMKKKFGINGGNIRVPLDDDVVLSSPDVEEAI
jgi:hypothetical protein